MRSVRMRMWVAGVCCWCAAALAGTAAAQAPVLPPGTEQPAPVVAPGDSGQVSPGDGGQAIPGGGGGQVVPQTPDQRGANPPGSQTQGSGGDGAGQDGCKPWWSRVPVVQGTPRTGWFLIPPTGPGYYSLADFATGNWRENPPKYPYPRFGFMATPMFDVDWRYLDNPKNTETDFFDFLKRRRFADAFLLTLGGEARYRYNNFDNFQLSGKKNQFDLERVRMFADLWYRDYFRVFVEVIDAQSFNQDFPPAPADRNWTDFQNLFAELKVWEFKDRPVFVRGGRQEMLFGSQRLISTVDWLNDRRTFEGVRGYWRGDKTDVDLFVTQPVIPVARKLDSSDNNLLFSGAWFNYRPKKGQTIDLYYLNLNDTNQIHRGQYGALGSANRHTLGTRYAGDYDGRWLWDFEGMVQFGDFANQNIGAGAFTTGVGYNFKDVWWTPSLWLYYDYASGDPHPGSGNVSRTFSQLFGFGHYYFGWIDVVGRQNIHDLNLQFAMYPTKWITTQLQYHVFRLDQAKDALFNAAGAPIRRDPTGLAGTNVGQEIDLLVNFHLTKHQDVVVGYSHLYAGDFLRQTGSGRDVDFVYAQWGFRW